MIAGTSAAPALAGGSLFGRAFLSTSIEKDGEPYPLWEDARLRVNFDHESGDREVVRWRASCNLYGSEFVIDGDRIVTGAVTSSAMGCSPVKREREDRFFARFFRANPTYDVSPDRLRLSARNAVIKLKQRG